MASHENFSNKLKPCPQCGDIPILRYVCGEYFIDHPNKKVGECFCTSFAEMHSNEDLEIKLWNEVVNDAIV